MQDANKELVNYYNYFKVNLNKKSIKRRLIKHIIYFPYEFNRF